MSKTTSISLNKATTLPLRDRKIGYDEIVDIVNALHQNKSVTKLDLGHNHISDAEVKYICDNLLNSNKTLKILHLDHNQIGSDGAESLWKKVLDSHPSLIVHLDHNHIEPELVEKIENSNVNFKLSDQCPLTYQQPRGDQDNDFIFAMELNGELVGGS